MSADNLIRIIKKENGLFQVRHEFASSLIHALNDIEPTRDELLIEIIADDVNDYESAIEKANKFEQEEYVEYGIVDKDWEK